MANTTCYPLSFKKYMICLVSLILILTIAIYYNHADSLESKLQKRKIKPNVIFLHNDDYKKVIEKNVINTGMKNNNIKNSFQIIGKMEVVNSSKTEEKCLSMLPGLEVSKPNCNLVHEFDIFEEISFKYSQSKIMGVGGKRIAWKVGYEHPVVLKTLRWEKNITNQFYHASMKDANAMEAVSFSNNIVHVYGYCASAVVNELGYMGADQYFKDRKISVKHKLQYSVQSAVAVADIHSVQARNHTALLHADLRPWNFLVVDEGRNIKIHDFNEAKFMKWNDQTNKPCGFTQYWCNRNRSPEECTQGAVLNEKIDIYGLGNFLFFILTGESPHKGFKKEISHQMVAQGIPPAFPSKIMKSKDPAITLLKRVISKCHIADPKKRPTAREVANDLINGYKLLTSGREYAISH